MGTDELESVWTSSWFGHGCFCRNGCSLCGRYMTLSWLGHGCSVKTDAVCVDVVMVGTWMLCGNGWRLCGRHHG